MNVNYKFKTLIRDVAFRTGVPYAIVKRIVLSHLRWYFFLLRRFSFIRNYYFRVIPDMEQYSNFTPVEKHKADKFNLLEKRARKRIARKSIKNRFKNRKDERI